MDEEVTEQMEGHIVFIWHCVKSNKDGLTKCNEFNQYNFKFHYVDAADWLKNNLFYFILIQGEGDVLPVAIMEAFRAAYT